MASSPHKIMYILSRTDGTEIMVATVVVSGNPTRSFADQSDGDALDVNYR